MHVLSEIARAPIEVSAPLEQGGSAYTRRNILPEASSSEMPNDASLGICQCAERMAEINPLKYPLWDSLLSSCPGSSLFHSAGWARVLHDTYGHRPMYFCKLAGDKLQEVLPVMEVSSLLTGRRGISLPFTDYCLPLTLSTRDQGALYERAIQQGQARGWRYLECRGDRFGWLSAKPSLAFYGHVIDLQSSEAVLFNKLESSVRRGIRKAQKAGLQIDFRTTIDSVRTFFVLHTDTRRRHGLPPQPFRFFESIARHVLARGHGFVVTARLEQRPIAAAVFLHVGTQAIYKFGASDFEFQHLRANNLIMWEAIKRYAGEGFDSLHLGRTSLSNEGLRRFKLGFGAREEKIEYYKFDFLKRAFVSDTDRVEGWFNRVFRILPSTLLRLTGQILYRHLS